MSHNDIQNNGGILSITHEHHCRAANRATCSRDLFSIKRWSLRNPTLLSFLSYQNLAVYKWTRLTLAGPVHWLENNAPWARLGGEVNANVSLCIACIAPWSGTVLQPMHNPALTFTVIKTFDLSIELTLVGSKQADNVRGPRKIWWPPTKCATKRLKSGVGMALVYVNIGVSCPLTNKGLVTVLT